MTNFPAFNKKEHRLDEFFFSTVKVQNHKNLALILKIVLTLSHGQAAVQRGFSVSKAVLDVNMQENSLIARKLIRDHMSSSNRKPHCMEVPNPMIRAYTSARDKYESSSVIWQKGESQNGGNKNTKHAKFSEKRTFFTP